MSVYDETLELLHEIYAYLSQQPSAFATSAVIDHFTEKYRDEFTRADIAAIVELWLSGFSGVSDIEYLDEELEAMKQLLARDAMLN